MIIFRYLVFDIFKNQCVILFVLFLIFMFHRLVRVLNFVIDGTIPIDFVLYLLVFSISEVAKFILPLSLFLAVLLTINRLYNEGELSALYSCGLGNNIFFIVVFFLIFFNIFVMLINVFWFSPWCLREYNDSLVSFKSDLNITSAMEGQFQFIKESNLVFFFDHFSSCGKINNVFIAYINSNIGDYHSIIIADRGCVINKSFNFISIILNQGNYYSFEPNKDDFLSRNFYVVNFDNYEVCIPPKIVLNSYQDVSFMTLYQLFSTFTSEACAEIYWRISLVISIFIMVLIVVPLSLMDMFLGSYLNIFISVFLYICFFLLHMLARSYSINEYLNPMICFLCINIFYCHIACILIFWNKICFFVRYLCFKRIKM